MDSLANKITAFWWSTDHIIWAASEMFWASTDCFVFPCSAAGATMGGPHSTLCPVQNVVVSFQLGRK